MLYLSLSLSLLSLKHTLSLSLSHFLQCVPICCIFQSVNWCFALGLLVQKICFFILALFSFFSSFLLYFPHFDKKGTKMRKNCLFPTADKQLNADPESGKLLFSWLLQVISTNCYHFFITFGC